MVVIYHLWPRVLPGGYAGVDVFFVISGFLITSQLLLLRPTQPAHLVGFWMRRVRRLLPAAVAVVTLTLLFSRLVAPPSQWRRTAQSSIASALDLQNWWLAIRSVNYLDADSPPTPFQHFWSLAVEEQFYLFWPVLLLVCGLAARRIWRNYPVVVLGSLSALTAVSLAVSILVTPRHPAASFYVTPTRVWELGAGALLATIDLRARDRQGPDPTPERRPRGGARRTVLGWTGLAIVGCSAVAFSDSTAWPGWAAAAPVVGTVALIAARTPSDSRLGAVMANRAVQWLGDVSYSLYLWHWPVVVLVPAAAGHPLSVADAFGVLVASLILAGLSKRFIEDRFRRHRQGLPVWRPFAAAAAGTAFVLALSGFQLIEVGHAENAAWNSLRSADLADECLGAGVRLEPANCVSRVAGAVVPSPVIAAVDVPASWTNGCLLEAPWTTIPRCVFGPADAKVNIALVGNSIASQWEPALRDLADRRGWRVTEYLAASCPVAADEYSLHVHALRDACLDWGRRVMAATTAGSYDLVVTSNLSEVDAATESHHAEWRRAYADYFARWRAHGIPVVVLRTTPQPRSTLASPADCVAENDASSSVCSGLRSAWVHPDAQAEAAVAMHDPGVSVADLTDLFCGTRCPSVIGNVLVYEDFSHITATYSRTLAPALEPYLNRSLGSGRR